VWKLFEWFKANPERGKKMRFAINTNLMPKTELLDKLIEQSHYIPHLEIYTSNEAKGNHAEYIRDGMDYNQWFKNLDRLQTEGNIKVLHCMMTINSLCLSSITEFMDDILDWKLKHSTLGPHMSLNILRFPSFQSAAILPDSMKQFYKNKLQIWLDKKIAERKTVDLKTWKAPILTESEISQVNRLIDYLDIVKTPHRNTADQPKLYNDFKTFYEQYDHRRKKDFRNTFTKDFVEFIDSIELLPEEKPILVKDPATTKSGYISDELSHGWDIEKDTLGKNV